MWATRLFATALAATSCASPAKGPVVAKPPAAKAVPPICSIETANVYGDRPLRERTFLPQNWFVLMLHAYRSTGEIPRPLNDCSGTPVGVEVDGCEGDARQGFTPTALTARDLVVTSLGETRRLVWVITERLSDGQGQGPVAIAEIEGKGISVRALGLLRIYPDNVSLRLERLSGATVLVADGQRCDVPDMPDSCERAVRVVPLVRDRFVLKPLVGDRGTCAGSSLFSVRTKGRAERAGGTKYEVETSVTFGANAIVVREQLALKRQSAARGPQNALGEVFVSRLQLERQITLRDGRLVTDGPSLLTRWLAQQDGGGGSSRPH